MTQAQNMPTEIDFQQPTVAGGMVAVTPTAGPAPEAATIFQIIERAARDQNVDIDKMERLILMQERMHARRAELEFDNAMADAQQEMQPVRKDANNPQTRSKYASYGALDTAIRPVYTRHGFSLSFDTADGAPADCVRVVCKVAHRSGHRERPHIDIPADGKGAKGGDVMTKTHATGSAVSYGKRYLLCMIFNIATGNDDDGNRAGSRPTPQTAPFAGNTLAEARREAIDSGMTNGETRSAYQVNKAKKSAYAEDAKKRSKDFIDARIVELNEGKWQGRDELEAWWDKHNKPAQEGAPGPIDWIKKNFPDQYQRLETAYLSAEASCR